ncbi:glycosyltransferase family 2 protein [Roseiconus lacunae]|uniref:glycosyltransferase family 2 protein n=1 Tax=Roseiconus lacunae TaxID=2605694 RepID=UPI003F52F242
MTDHRSDVSIVIPCFNAGQVLSECIESALSQTLPAREVIVVDDGSSDSSIEIASNFGPPVRVISQANQGANCARRNGTSACRGSLVAFQDADDSFSRTRLEELVNAMESNKECIAAIGATSVVSTNSILPEASFTDTQSTLHIAGTLDRMLQLGSPIAGAMNLLTTTAHAKDAFRVGAGYPAANDLDFQLRLATKGDFVLSRHVSCWYRPGANGITARGASGIQPACAILACLDALGASSDPMSRQKVRARLRERGPTLIPPLLKSGHYQIAMQLSRRLLLNGHWHTIPRRIWWGVQETAARRDRKERAKE